MSASFGFTKKCRFCTEESGRHWKHRWKFQCCISHKIFFDFVWTCKLERCKFTNFRQDQCNNYAWFGILKFTDIQTMFKHFIVWTIKFGVFRRSWWNIKLIDLNVTEMFQNLMFLILLTYPMSICFINLPLKFIKYKFSLTISYSSEIFWVYNEEQFTLRVFIMNFVAS